MFCSFLIGKYLLYNFMLISGASLVAQMVKNLPAMQETWVPSQDWQKHNEVHFEFSSLIS